MSFSINVVGTKAGVAAAVGVANVNGQQLGEIARTAVLAAIEQIAQNGVEVAVSGHQDASYGNVSISVAGKVFAMDQTPADLEAPVEDEATPVDPAA